MSVAGVKVGAVSDSSAVVVAQVDSLAAVRVAVDTEEALSSPTFHGPVTPTGEDNGVTTDGSSGNYATTPHHSSMQITGDIDLRAEVTLDDWHSAAADGVRSTFLGKWSGSQRAYFLGVEDDGRVSLFWSTTGSNSALRHSTVSVPFTTGRFAVRATLDADNGASGHDVTFYTAGSMDGPWTQLGAVVTNSGSVTIFSGTSEASVCAVDGGSGRPLAGIVHRAEIRSGINGTVVANPRFDQQTPGTSSFAGATGKTWTLQGTAAITVSVAVAKVAITGLDPDTRYHYAVEHNSTVDSTFPGQFLTDPPVGSTGVFTIGFSGDAGLQPETPGVGDVLAANRLSNHTIFDTVRQRALAEVWRRFCHLGDDHYYDFGSGLHGIHGGGSIHNYVRARRDILAQPRQHQLYREVAGTLQPDDHDRAFNDHDSTFTEAFNYNRVYRRWEPHYDLPDTDPAGGLYFSFQIRRTLFIAADVRSFRDPNSDPDGPGKTMLGAAQLAWMDDLLATTDAKFLVWLMPDQWMGIALDSWGSFQHEQSLVVDMFATRGFLGRICILGADAHMIALDTGGNSPGGIPVLQAAALDAAPTGDPTRYNLGGRSGRDQYGSLTVDDRGSHLIVTMTGWVGSGTLVSHTYEVTGDPLPALASGAFGRALSGSHTATFDARVIVDGFFVGDTPPGVDIPVLGGDVTFDGTAEIRATLELETAGVDEATGKSMWPRRADGLLAPYGNEIFVRRGIDFGGAGILWIPLGYFRINTPEQDDAPYGNIRISGQDRMAGIVDGRLLAPREYGSNRSVSDVFHDLVREIYPSAVVLFDDGSGGASLGRPLVVEESRYQVLRDIADSLGKVMFWDGEGFLRVVSAPDPGEPVWQVAAGPAGVQVQASRKLTREGVYNAVVAVGEGGDDADPVRAVAVDANRRSPTFFGGRFGRVPRFYFSPMLTTTSQAATAAAAILRRSIGMPYSVDFQAVANPTLRPFDPIRITHQDRNRELHVVETVTIPLDEETAMSCTTREQTFVRVEV